MSDRRFASISDILELAVRREIEAAEGYARIAAAASTPALRELAEDLRRQEEEHRRLLEGLDAAAVRSLAPADVPDIGVVDALDDERLAPDMSLQDMLVFAAKKEAQAAAFYGSLAERAAGTGQRTLFLFLAGQERDHKFRLETAYEAQFLPEN